MHLKLSQLFLVLVFLLVSVSSFADSRIDSLENKLELGTDLSNDDLIEIHYTLAALYSFDDFGKSLEHAQQVVRIRKKMGLTGRESLGKVINEVQRS